MRWKDNSEIWAGKNLAGCSHGLLQDAILTSAWTDWGKPWKPWWGQPVAQPRFKPGSPKYKSREFSTVSVLFFILFIFVPNTQCKHTASPSCQGK